MSTNVHECPRVPARIDPLGQSAAFPTPRILRGVWNEEKRSARHAAERRRSGRDRRHPPQRGPRQKEDSIDDQQDHAREIVAEWCDGPVDFTVINRTVTGERLDRPELTEIEDLLRPRAFDRLACADLGRLVRGTAATDLSVRHCPRPRHTGYGPARRRRHGRRHLGGGRLAPRDGGRPGPSPGTRNGMGRGSAASPAPRSSRACRGGAAGTPSSATRRAGARR